MISGKAHPEPKDGVDVGAVAYSRGMWGERDWTLSAYRDLLKQYPKLGPWEERELALRAPNDESARFRLILSNLRTVLWWAREFVHTGVDPEDLVQAGILGLMKALPEYKPHKSVRLSSFAKWSIRAEMQQLVAQVAFPVRLPREKTVLRAGADRPARIYARSLSSIARESRAMLDAGIVPRTESIFRLERGASRLDREQLTLSPVDEEVLNRLEHDALSEALARAMRWLSEKEKEALILAHSATDSEALQVLWEDGFTDLHDPEAISSKLKFVASHWRTAVSSVHRARARALSLLRDGAPGYWLRAWRPAALSPYSGPAVWHWDVRRARYTVRSAGLDLEIGRTVVLYVRVAEGNPHEVRAQIRRAASYLRDHEVRGLERLPERHDPGGGVFVDVHPGGWATPAEQRPAFRELLDFVRTHPRAAASPGYVVMYSPDVFYAADRHGFHGSARSSRVVAGVNEHGNPRVISPAKTYERSWWQVHPQRMLHMYYLRIGLSRLSLEDGTHWTMFFVDPFGRGIPAPRWAPERHEDWSGWADEVDASDDYAEAEELPF